MWAEPFAKYLPRVPMLQWLEPAWKMMLQQQGNPSRLLGAFPRACQLTAVVYAAGAARRLLRAEAPAQSRGSQRAASFGTAHVVANAEGECGRGRVRAVRPALRWGITTAFTRCWAGGWWTTNPPAWAFGKIEGLVTGNRSQFVSALLSAALKRRLMRSRQNWRWFRRMNLHHP
jgi:hypothetical protein